MCWFLFYMFMRKNTQGDVKKIVQTFLRYWWLKNVMVNPATYFSLFFLNVFNKHFYSNLTTSLFSSISLPHHFPVVFCFDISAFLCPTCFYVLISTCETILFWSTWHEKKIRTERKEKMEMINNLHRVLSCHTWA